MPSIEQPFSTGEHPEQDPGLSNLFKMVLSKYHEALFKHQASLDFRFLLADTLPDGTSVASMVLVDDMYPARLAETIEVVVRTSEINDFESAPLWLEADPDRFFIVWHRKGSKERAFLFKQSGITPYATKQWSGKHWHRKPHTPRYYEEKFKDLKIIPIRERE